MHYSPSCVERCFSLFLAGEVLEKSCKLVQQCMPSPKLMPSSSLCQVQNDVKCNDSTLYCKLLSCGVSRRCRTRRRCRRSRGVTPTGSLSRLCQTPSGSVTSCCGKRVNTRAAAVLVSHVSICPHLTHSCDTIHIPAALSLPPYQCSNNKDVWGLP